MPETLVLLCIHILNLRYTNFYDSRTSKPRCLSLQRANCDTFLAWKKTQSDKGGAESHLIKLTLSWTLCPQEAK